VNTATSEMQGEERFGSDHNLLTGRKLGQTRFQNNNPRVHGRYWLVWRPGSESLREAAVTAVGFDLFLTLGLSATAAWMTCHTGTSSSSERRCRPPRGLKPALPASLAALLKAFV
jgi:hypothetical protein